ncbi:MAG: GbsR/MarR family transcriptional regulator [Phototrophicaceae bacterium]|jgi:DNA-binding transcriptional regulator GbsR (MarR family)
MSGLQNPDLKAVHDSMLNGLGQLSDYFGFSKVMGQLYSIVLLSPEPLCLDDFVERLSISKASVSMNLRTLEHLGMVRRVWTSDSSDRRKFYEAETDFWQIITNVLTGREMRDVERAISTLEVNITQLREALPQMSDKDQEIAGLYVERIEQIEALFRFALLILKTILTQIKPTEAVEDISNLKMD